MNRSIILCIAIALSAAIAPATSAWADDPAPSKEQLEAAKKAFGEGKALYDEGKFPEAVEKFKESYRLSTNPLLLYNIGHTLDQAGVKDKALFYYRKFLADAPQTARRTAQGRHEARRRHREGEPRSRSTASTPTPTTTTPATTPATATKVEEPKKELKVKPAGTYGEGLRASARRVGTSGKPLDITAFVPEDSGFTVTLYYIAAAATPSSSRSR